MPLKKHPINRKLKILGNLYLIVCFCYINPHYITEKMKGMTQSLRIKVLVEKRDTRTTSLPADVRLASSGAGYSSGAPIWSTSVCIAARPWPEDPTPVGAGSCGGRC